MDGQHSVQKKSPKQLYLRLVAGSCATKATATGHSEVLRSTGVPKGSFYYYFDSKKILPCKSLTTLTKPTAKSCRVYLEDKLQALDRLKAIVKEGRRQLIQTTAAKAAW